MRRRADWGLIFSPGPFEDVLGRFWAAAAIGRLARAGLALVPAAHRFDPYGAEQRAEFVLQLVLAVHSARPRAVTAVPYPDVRRSDPALAAVAYAKRHGWVLFPTARGFLPTARLTRQAAYTLVAEALFYNAAIAGADPAALARFRSRWGLAPWAVQPVAALQDAGYLGPLLTPGGRLDPQGVVSRADAAVILQAVASWLVTLNGGRFRVVDAMPLRATVYGPAIAGMGAYTATGVRAHLGVAAVDPASIPLGTYLWVTGYAPNAYLPPHGILEQAEDTGPAVGPGDIDLWIDAATLWPYEEFGVQQVRAEVLVPVPGQPGPLGT